MSEDWKAALPEDLKNNPTLESVPDVAALAKMAVDLKAYQGGSVRIPSENATPEDWKAFDAKLMEKVPGLSRLDPESPEAIESVLKTLGKPEEAANYEIPEVEGVEIPEERIGELRKTAHELGLTKAQFKEFLDRSMKADADAIMQAQTLRESGLKELRGEWGQAYDEKVSNIRKLAEMTKAPQDLIDALQNQSANAEALRWLDNIAGRMGKEPAEFGDRTGASGTLVPEEARAQREEIRSRIMAMDTTDPRYMSLVNKMHKLTEMAQT